MTHTLNPTADLATDIDDVARLVTPDGERVADPDLERWVADVDAAALRSLYRDMVLVRRIDTEGVALQRQGQLGLWAPCQGQEATQVGTARAFRADDFVFPSYREIGVNYVRGAKPADFVIAWRGEEHSTYNPYDINTATPQIIIGAQALHAVGYAMGIQRDGTDQVAAAYFGDGASSQGDVNEAMVFASSFRAPVVFVCTNNQWAISEPVAVQAKFPIAGRAPGFGIPSMRVDGNDVLACLAAMRWALDNARQRQRPRVHRGRDLPHGPAHHLGRPHALPRQGRGRALAPPRPDRPRRGAAARRGRVRRRLRRRGRGRRRPRSAPRCAPRPSVRPRASRSACSTTSTPSRTPVSTSSAPGSRRTSTASTVRREEAAR